MILNNYKNIFIYPYFLFFSFIIVNSFGYMMFDDGWRHLAMAVHQEEIKSWGNLFIHTLYKEFDPWFVWHNILKNVGILFGNENIHLTVNTIVYFALSIWYYQIISKYTKIQSIFILLIASFLPMYSYRYFYLRPDVLSGLFLIYILLIENRTKFFLLSFLYSISYYVSWFFIGYIAFVKLILKDYRKTLLLALALILSILFYSLYDYKGFVEITTNVFNNENLTSIYSVTESKPKFLPLEIKNLLGGSLFLFILISFSLLIYYVLKPNNIVLKYLILLMPLIIFQNRFYGILEPLIFACFVIYLSKLTFFIKENGLKVFFEEIKFFLEEKTYFLNFPKKQLPKLLFVLLFLFFASSYLFNQKVYSLLNRQVQLNTFMANEEFKNKRILINNMNLLMNTSILLNPSAKYVTSFSLGWVDYKGKMRESYFSLINSSLVVSGEEKEIKEKDLIDFINYNEIDYFIIDTKYDINFTLSKEILLENKFHFHKIIKDYIIFKKEAK